MQFTLESFDYILLIGLLTICLGIGVYLGFFSKQPKTTEDYLLGNRNMNSITVAISLITSQISVIHILTLPVEVYRFGLHAIWLQLSLYLVLPLIMFIILPIFHETGIWNCFEYLERRFDRKTRNLVTIAYIIRVYLMLPILIFIPSLLFSQLTDINVHLINGIVCSVCVFYTMRGGVKVVVWTQIIQGLIILTTFVSIIVLILMNYDFEDIIRRANNGGRLYATNFSLDLTTRETFWNTLIGGSFSWICLFAVEPTSIQRFVSIKSTKASRRSLVIFAFLCTILSLMLYFIGISMYSRFYYCDPLKTEITKDLVTFFVQDLTKNSKIIFGFYKVCLFCAAMSTMSSNLNTTAGIIYSHFFTEINDSMDSNNQQKQNDDEKRANLIMRTIIIVTGIYSIVGGLLIEKFNWIIQIVFTASGVTQCFLTGLFLFAILYPKAIGDAAFRATYFSILISVLIQFGTLIQKSTGLIHDYDLSVKVENCNEFNITTIGDKNFTMSNHDSNEAGALFKISFYWYSVIASGILWFYGVPWSKLMKYNKIIKKINPKLVSSLVAKWIPETKIINDKSNECEMKFLNGHTIEH